MTDDPCLWSPFQPCDSRSLPALSGSTGLSPGFYTHPDRPGESIGVGNEGAWGHNTFKDGDIDNLKSENHRHLATYENADQHASVRAITAGYLQLVKEVLQLPGCPASIPSFYRPRRRRSPMSWRLRRRSRTMGSWTFRAPTGQERSRSRR